VEADERREFAELLIGLSDSNGNYSAVERGLGPLILSEKQTPINRIWDLATELREVESAHEVPKIIRKAGLRYLQIGVGSEASCMLNPEVCWVCNSRTIWTQLVIKHADDFNKADYRRKGKLKGSPWNGSFAPFRATYAVCADG
jgi:hypothetical protein